MPPLMTFLSFCISMGLASCRHWPLRIVLFETIAFFVCHGLASSHSNVYYGRQQSFITQPTCSRRFYSVVFDAGSTGSRVFVFQFKHKERGSLIKLSEEYFSSSEPGISSFSHNVTEVSTRLKPLLDYAEKHVPLVYHRSTLLSFKATAGLRLLPKEIGDKIMNEVRMLLKESSFSIPDPQKIDVLGGDEEGLFGWVTANFLLGTLWGISTTSTVAAVDLGGGSVQITYAPSSPSALNASCSHGFGKLYHIQLLTSAFEIFTYSALGYGLRSAQLHIMGGREEIITTDRDETHDGEKAMVLASPCFVPSYKSTWKHGRHTYTILGEMPVESRLKDCQQKVDHFVHSLQLSGAVYLSQQDVYLFSYFFDVAQWTGMIHEDSVGEMLTSSKYYDTAKQFCKEENFSSQDPFHCMSLLYIHSLLTKGLGFPENRPLHVRSEIKRKRLSWTLGLALFNVDNHLEVSKVCNSL